MKFLTLVVAVLAVALTGAAQDFEIDTNTPEGQLLQQIGMQEDPQQQVSLLEQFTTQYPKHEGIGWVWGQLPPLYEKLGQTDKVFPACNKMLEAKPTNAAGAHGCLKTAEAQKDPDLISEWAAKTHAAAKKVVEAPKPDFEFEDEEEEWKENVEFSTQVGQYAEYSIYAAFLQTPDPQKKLELQAALKQLNPENQYLPQLVPLIFNAYRQLGDNEKAVALAEEILLTDQTNEDMLLVVADHHMNQTKDSEKVLDYSGKLVTLMETKAAPEGVTPEQWEAKKKQSLGLGYWMIGVTQSSKGRLTDADKSLRKALPHIKDNQQMLAAALFHLGVANFKLGDKSGNQKRILAGFNYTKQCAAIKSPFQSQAAKNLKAIQTQYRIK